MSSKAPERKDSCTLVWPASPSAHVEQKSIEGKMIWVGRCSSRGVLGGAIDHAIYALT